MRALLVALVLLALLPAEAAALPGDPPIVPRSPAPGATVPADPKGVAVSFDCPAYTIAVYSAGETIYRESGDFEDYDVRFSDQPGLGPDGRLASQPYGSDASAVPNPAGATCSALLDTYDTSSSPEILGGTVYWQASRYCNGCDGNQREFGPVQSFVILPQAVKATLQAPKHPYAGYLNVYSLALESPLSGAKVELQRRTGKRWRTVATEAFTTDATKLIAKLPAGRQLIRARVLTATTSFTVAQRSVAVRRAGARQTAARDDGPYKARKAPGKSTLQFRLSGGGSKLSAFKASVTTFCFGPTPETNHIYLGYALLDSVAVAPDGSVTGLLETKKGARVLLTGRLHNRRFKGEVELSLSTCSGTRKLDAVHGLRSAPRDTSSGGPPPQRSQEDSGDSEAISSPSKISEIEKYGEKRFVARISSTASRPSSSKGCF